MECLNQAFHNLKVTNPHGGDQLVQDGQEIVCCGHVENKMLNESMARINLTENGSVNQRDKLFLKCKEEENSSSEEENELIERGPTSSRTKYRSHPYPQSNGSPSSCSESSQDSPLNYNNERCPLSGGSLIINIESSIDNLNTEDNVLPPSIPQNRHTYIHKAGGKFQIIDHAVQVTQNISLNKFCVDLSDLITNFEYGKEKLSSNLSNYSNSDFKDHFHSSGIFEDSPRDPYSPSDASLSSCSPHSQHSIAFSSENLSILSSDVLSSDTSVNEFENFSICDEDTPINNDLPEDLKDFILEENNNVSEPNPILLQKYSEKINDLLKDESPAAEVTSPLLTEKKILHQHQDLLSCVCIPSVVSNMNKSPPIRDQENNLKNCSVVQSFVKNFYVVNPTYVLVRTPESKLRPLAPKPTLPKETSVDIPTIESRKKTPSISDDDQTEQLRASILRRFSEDEKRLRHREITKISNENILKTFEEGDTLLHIALFNNILTSVYLIDRFSKLSSLDVMNKSGETPLLNAVTTQQIELIKYLLHKGANPNVCILKSGSTILHYVAQRGKSYLEVLEILCSSPQTDINIYNSEGRTPLMSAVDSHENEIKLNNPNNSVIIDSIPTIRLLLKYGASVTCTHRCNGKTVFHLAVEKQNLQLLQLLCYETKATHEEINKKTFAGNTPLHLVGAMNDCDKQLRINFINLLVKYGASLKATNVCNKIPADLVDKHWKEVKRLLTPSRHL